MSFLPDEDIEYLTSKNIVYEEITDGNQRGLIIKNYILPKGKYDNVAVSLLILILEGYPDIPLDMFYTFPWIKVLSEGKFPKAADNTVNFNGIGWQRWSRHFDHKEWRPCCDGLHTYIKKIEYALQEAKP